MLKRISIVAILLAACGYLAWRFLIHETPLDQMEAMQAQLELDGDQRLSREKRREIYEKMEATYETMSAEDRREWNIRQEADDRWDKEIDAYFALPPDQRAAHIDERIDQMEEMRRIWEQRRASGDNPRGDRDRDRGDRGERPGGPGPVSQAAGSGGGGGPGGGPGGGDRGGRGGGGWSRGMMTPEQRNARRRDRLDSTTPMRRAQRAEYARAFRERLVERGIQFPRGR